MSLPSKGADAAVMDAEKRVGQYVAVRARLRELDKAHEEQRKPLLQMQEVLSGWLQTFLRTTGSESVRTKLGTCYLTTRYTASLADPEAFMNYVIQSGKFELIDRRANATAVQDYVKETGVLPPGANLNAIQTVGVRAPTGG